MSDPLTAYLESRKRPKFNWRKRAFDKQVQFIEDPARLKYAWTTRRGAKSYADGIYLLKEMDEHPRCNVLYLGLTRLSAKGIIWKDVLEDINEKDSLGIKFNQTELTFTHPNGALGYVAGVDVDETERRKLFGRKYRLVIIDEAALYTINLRDLVYVTLKPAMTDTRGTIALTGMSSNITQGLFYDVTTGKEKGWSGHEWSAHDNPFVAKQWQEELDEISRLRPDFMQTPMFQQAYLNKWVTDEDAKVYKFSDRNWCKELPQYDTPFNYVLGIDLGHNPDPSAFVIGAYHPADPMLYLIHAEKALNMDITAVADKIRELEKHFTFEVKIVDNANAQAVAELNNRHKLNLLAAEKHGKQDFINLMNSEFIQRKIMLTHAADLLAREYMALVWVTEDGEIKLSSSGQRKEHPGIANHCTDAALYLWRYCFNYLFNKAEKPIDWSAQERWESAHVKKLEDQVRQEQNPNALDATGLFDDNLFDFEQDDAI